MFFSDRKSWVALTDAPQINLDFDLTNMNSNNAFKNKKEPYASYNDN